jgi:parallel beta-helix repeat protein/predicted outer membrane repeat protein
MAIICLPAFATIIDIPDDYPTIQQGIDASTEGDTVLVQPGTYVENIDFNGHNIVLGSLFLTTGDTTYISQTVIDGDESGSVVRFTDGENSTAIISGFTLTNGRGGIYCNNSSPTMSNNIIMRNHSNSNGGGIACFDYSSPDITNNTISQNTANLTGGGIYCQDSDPFIYDNTIDSNTALNAGGGICCNNSSPRIENNILVENHAENNYGGGIACFTSSNPEIIGNTINLNTTNSEGGGICCYSSNPIIDNNIIDGNIALGQGGGIFAQGCEITARQNEIYNNTGSDGGGIAVRSSIAELQDNIIRENTAVNGGGIHCNNSDAIIIDNIITENTAHHGGAGVDNFGGVVALLGCIISANNAGDYGGGISNDMCSPIIANCVITNNTASGAGGGISNYTYSEAVLLNCTFSNNSADYGGAIWNGGSTPSLVNCILWGDSPDEHSGSESNITYSNIQGGWEGEGNIDCDPLFCDPEDGNYYLAENSCCAGAGENGEDIGALGVGCEPTGITGERLLPIEYSFHQNYPNPFNAVTVIRYSLPEPADVAIEIYDILGRRIETLVNERQSSGYHQAVWDANDRSSGIFFYRIQAADHAETRKMLLLK